MFGLSPMIILGVVLAFAVSNGVSYGVGHHQGYAAEHDKFVAFQTDVKAKGDAQIARNKQIAIDQATITKQTSDDYEAKIAKIHQTYAGVQTATVQATTAAVTKGVSNDYEGKISALHRYYNAAINRVSGNSTNSGSSGVPAVSGTSCGADARPTDNGLAERCAITTQEYVSLREWLRNQRAVK